MTITGSLQAFKFLSLNSQKMHLGSFYLVLIQFTNIKATIQ